MAEKKGRKVGRNATRCKAYRASQTREFNKARRIMRYLRKHGSERVSWEALEKLAGKLFTAQRQTLGIADFLKRKPL